MNDIREFECDIRNVEGDFFECDSIVSEVGGANALASPTGNSSARGVRKEQRSYGYPGGNAPNSEAGRLCSRSLLSLAVFWLELWLRWPFFGLRFGFCPRNLLSLAVFWLELWLRWPFFGSSFGFVGRFLA